LIAPPILVPPTGIAVVMLLAAFCAVSVKVPLVKVMPPLRIILPAAALSVTLPLVVVLIIGDKPFELIVIVLAAAVACKERLFVVKETGFVSVRLPVLVRL